MMECPNGWLECSLCAHEKKCKADDYKGEENVDVVVKAAEVAAKVVNAEVVKNIESIRGTWPDKFNAMTEEERWKEHRKYPTPNLHTIVDPYKAEVGAIVPGGGGTAKAKKSKKGNKPTVYIWGENP